jgi:hypothetical protein
MGQLYQGIKLKETFERFGIKNFVETGTGIADSLTEVIIQKPEKLNIYTIELMDELYQPLVERFGDIPYINLIKGYSDVEIVNVLKTLSSEPTLFWHDAHFPGADFNINGATYWSEPDYNKRLPLEAELRAIKNSGRDISNDVIICDDRHVYIDDNYEGGPWQFRSIAGGDGINFIYEMFEDTHIIIETITKQGYMILFPKSTFTENDRDLIR